MKKKMKPQKISIAKNQHGETNTHVFFMSGNRQIASVLHALYKEATISLARKQTLYNALIKQNQEYGNFKTNTRYT